MPWFASWGLVSFGAYRTSNYVDQKLALANAGKGDPNMADIYLRMSDDAGRHMGQAFFYGFALPLALLILFGVGLWVHRGFKPRA